MNLDRPGRQGRSAATGGSSGRASTTSPTAWAPTWWSSPPTSARSCSVDAIMDTLAANPDTKIVSVVHAETSTGAEFPLQELAEAMRAAGLRGAPLRGLRDLAGRPAGGGRGLGTRLRLLLLAEGPGVPARARARDDQRPRDRGDAPARGPGPVLLRLRGALEVLDRPARSRTTTRCRSCSTTRCTRACASRSRRDSRLGGRATRTPAGTSRTRSGRAGFELLADPDHQLVELTAVKVPEGVDGKEVQTRILREHGIEVGGGLGPEGAADLARGADGREREPRDRRSGARRVRRRAAPVAP